MVRDESAAQPHGAPVPAQMGWHSLTPSPPHTPLPISGSWGWLLTGVPSFWPCGFPSCGHLDQASFMQRLVFERPRQKLQGSTGLAWQCCSITITTSYWSQSVRGPAYTQEGETDSRCGEGHRRSGTAGEPTGKQPGHPAENNFQQGEPLAVNTHLLEKSCATASLLHSPCFPMS